MGEIMPKIALYIRKAKLDYCTNWIESMNPFVTFD